MKIEKINEANFDEKIKNRGSIAVVDFYADWCGPCKMFVPTLESLADDHTDVEFFKVNVDENPNLSRTYAVMSIPTLIIFKEGSVQNTLIGLRQKDEISDIIEELQK